VSQSKLGKTMTINAVTWNLGCASPSAGQGARREAATAWAAELIARAPDLVFAQEVPNIDWLSTWTARGYRQPR